MNFFVQQEITDMPNGFYTLSACVGSDPGNTITLYINGKEWPVKASAEGKAKAVYDTLTQVYVGNHKLIIGAKSSTWFKADDFRLTYTPSIDYTFAIVNPTIEASGNNVQPTGWTVNKGTGNNITGTGQHYSGNTANRYLDSWNGTAGSMIYVATQLVDSLPNGIYTLKSAARSSGNGAYIFANDKQTEIPVNYDQNGELGRGWNWVKVEQVVVLDSTMTIGAKTTKGWTGTWFSADEFTLEYFGEADSATYKPYLDSLLAKAKAFDQATSPNGVDAWLNQAIDQATAATDIATAYSSLKKAYQAALESVSSYAELDTLIKQANSLATTTSYSGLPQLNEAINKAQTTFTGSNSMKADIVAAVSALKKAIFTYKTTQPASVNAPADFTFALVNPSFETGTLEGWTISTGASDAGVKPNSNATYTMQPIHGNYLFNIWGGTTLPFFVEQTITGLPDGYYTLTALVASDAGNTITLYMNDQLKNVSASASGKGTTVRDSISKIQLTTGQLVIGARSQTWFKADDFHLIYYGTTLTGLDQPNGKIIVFSMNHRILVSGTDEYEIFDIQGVRYQKDQAMKPGIYFVKTKEQVVKVSVK